ncbi:hypothetical protein, partial [Immundisolibacter sp.]
KMFKLFILLFAFSLSCLAELTNPVTEDTLNLSDTTTNDFSTTKHGFVPKGTNAGNCLKDNGTWGACGAGGGGSPAGSTNSVQYNNAGAFGGAANVTIDSGDLNLTAAVSATPTVSSGIKIFGRTVAGRNLPAFVGPSGLDSSIQPFLARNKIGIWAPPGNATTVPGVFGFTAVTATGTATLRNVATTNVLTRTKRLAYVSAATAGSLAGARVAVAQHTTGTGSGVGGFTYVVRFGTSDAAAVAGARAFIGLSSSTAAPTNVEPSTLTNAIGVAQLSTDNTQWYIVYGGSAAQTAIALGTTLGAPTDKTALYELALFSSPNSNAVINYQVTNVGTGATATGTLSGTAGTTTPANTTLLTPQIWRTNNATALAVGIDIISIYIETDW